VPLCLDSLQCILAASQTAEQRILLEIKNKLNNYFVSFKKLQSTVVGHDDKARLIEKKLTKNAILEFYSQAISLQHFKGKLRGVTYNRCQSFPTLDGEIIQRKHHQIFSQGGFLLN